MGTIRKPGSKLVSAALHIFYPSVTIQSSIWMKAKHSIQRVFGKRGVCNQRKQGPRMGLGINNAWRKGYAPSNVTDVQLGSKTSFCNFSSLVFSSLLTSIGTDPCSISSLAEMFSSQRWWSTVLDLEWGLPLDLIVFSLLPSLICQILPQIQTYLVSDPVSSS